MKKLYILLLVACFGFSAQVEAQINITFRVTLKGSGRKMHADSLRVTGALGVTSPAGVADWTPASAVKMKLRGPVADSIYAITYTVTRPANSIIEYKFLNGGAWGDGAGGASEDERGLTPACTVTGGSNRAFTIPAGTALNILLPTYRFNTCTVVFATNTNELTTATNLDFMPNPVTTKAFLTFDNANDAVHSLDIINVMGQMVRTYPAQRGSQFEIDRDGMAAGVYFARLRNEKGQSQNTRFVVE